VKDGVTGREEAVGGAVEGVEGRIVVGGGDNTAFKRLDLATNSVSPLDRVGRVGRVGRVARVGSRRDPLRRNLKERRS